MKFYGQFVPPVDKFIFERYFPEVGIEGVFVECGAFDGETECSCRFFEETMGWKGYNLEPVPWIYERLVANRPNSTNINVGLSELTASLPFQSVVHPKFGRETTIGAIHHSPEFKEALISDGCTFEEITIGVISWGDFVKSHCITRIDLLVLDVEGHEISVLAGMRGSSVLPNVMCVEFGHTGFPAIREMLAELGYEYDIHSHANAFFVKREFLPMLNLRAVSAHEKEKSNSEIKKLSALSDELQSRLELRELEVIRLQARERDLSRHLHAIENSRSWKLLRLAAKLAQWRKAS